MRQAGIHDAVRERAERNRGRVAVFDPLNPRHTTHIVVDLQNGSVDHGQLAEVAMACTIVPNVNRISAALRAAGARDLYAAHGGFGCTWPVFFEHFFGPERRARFIEAFTPGTPGKRPLVGAGGGPSGCGRPQALVRRFRAICATQKLVNSGSTSRL
jgi:ureidoacrylate peracid hydrolase